MRPRAAEPLGMAMEILCGVEPHHLTASREASSIAGSAFCMQAKAAGDARDRTGTCMRQRLAAELRHAGAADPQGCP